MQAIILKSQVIACKSKQSTSKEKSVNCKQSIACCLAQMKSNGLERQAIDFKVSLNTWATQARGFFTCHCM
jgi:hypothetical protein